MGAGREREREREAAMGKAEKLLELHNSSAHTGQKEQWQADLKVFEDFKADFEDEKRRLRGEAYQLLTWYAAFQAVIFTAVSQASLLTCQLWWCPFSLSVTVSAATLLAIADKLYSIGEVKEDMEKVDRNTAAIQGALDELDKEGADLNLEIAQPHQEIPRNRRAGYQAILSKEGIFTLLCLSGFSALIACFSTKSLCLHCPRCL